ncbi:hypothetical protein [Aquimarina sediminis]|uniref:hypothetical protein n=1 Tax=Aquimarina sediminis TaxID=2070536 RepID=UPI000FFE5416|nr:hypothetical protein [Aquimarina sediminis]
MNRRNFLTSSTLLGIGTLSMFPSTIITNSSSISIFDMGNGFRKLSDQTIDIPVEFLSSDALNAHKKLINILNTKEYYYNNLKITKLTNNCYAIPLSKKPLVGFKTKELALLVKEQDSFKHYILNERISAGFNSLIENFSKNIDSNKLNIDILSFISPVKIVKESHGVESVFIYENEQKNKITLKSSSKRQLAIIS